MASVSRSGAAARRAHVGSTSGSWIAGVVALLLTAPALAQPSPAGLAELQGELDLFERRMRSFRSSVDAVARRQAAELRRDVRARHDPAIRAEQREARAAREAAMGDLERFVREHPRDPRHTPHALLRLAELRLSRALDRADGPGAPPDYADTIAAAREVVHRFPASPERGAAAYLWGWALERGDRRDEAADVWRAEVCPGGGAPYEACADRGAELATSIWLRLGAHHLARGELSAAIGAFGHAAEADDRGALLGLHQLAWTQQRAGRHDQAVARFAELLDRLSDAPDPELRDSATRHLVGSLVEEDWDHDGVPDHADGGAHPLERLEDDAVWPRDRPWSSEVYRRVAAALLDEGHPDEARMAYRLLLASAECDATALRGLADVERRMGLTDELAHTRARLDACSTLR